MGWEHHHFNFQFSKSIRSSTFHIFVNLTYPLRKNISFPKISLHVYPRLNKWFSASDYYKTNMWAGKWKILHVMYFFFLYTVIFTNRNGRGTPRKIGWGFVARFPKPLPYLWPNSAFFPTLLKPDQKFDRCIWHASCRLNIIYEGLLLAVLSIILKK